MSKKILFCISGIWNLHILKKWKNYLNNVLEILFICNFNFCILNTYLFFIQKYILLDQCQRKKLIFIKAFNLFSIGWSIVIFTLISDVRLYYYGMWWKESDFIIIRKRARAWVCILCVFVTVARNWRELWSFAGKWIAKPRSKQRHECTHCEHWHVW